MFVPLNNFTVTYEPEPVVYKNDYYANYGTARSMLDADISELSNALNEDDDTSTPLTFSDYTNYNGEIPLPPSSSENFLEVQGFDPSFIPESPN